MAYGTLYLQPKWFDEETPTNPHKASATLTFDGVPVVAETVTIGTEVYEFVAAADDIAEEDNIAVVLGVTLTADKAVTELAKAINANSTLVDAVADTTDDTCIITYKNIGTEGNDITISTDATNADFDDDATKLSGGSYGTPCIMKNIVIKGTEYYYWCEKEGGKSTVSWKRFTPAPY